jgi:hypothetical protein
MALRCLSPGSMTPERSSFGGQRCYPPRHVTSPPLQGVNPMRPRHTLGLDSIDLVDCSCEAKQRHPLDCQCSFRRLRLFGWSPHFVAVLRKLASSVRDNHNRKRRLIARGAFWRLAIIAICGPMLLAGCGSQGLGASTSCRDFMNASPQAQDEAVSKVASQLDAPNAVTPLGRPNVDYLCASEPAWTLGEAVRHTG